MANNIRYGKEAPVVNVGDNERLISIVGGGLLSFVGSYRGGLRGTCLAFKGTYLILRGVTGLCPIYRALGVNTLDESSVQNVVEQLKQRYPLVRAIDSAAGHVRSLRQ